MVLEDEALILLDLESVLQDAGAVVFATTNLKGAQKVLDTQTLDGAFLDVHLDEQDIFDGPTCLPVTERLSKIGIPFVFISGDLELGEWAKSYDAPALLKPYDPDRIIELAREMVDRSLFVPPSQRSLGENRESE